MSRSAGAGRPTRSTSIRCPTPRRRLLSPVIGHDTSWIIAHQRATHACRQSPRSSKPTDGACGTATRKEEGPAGERQQPHRVGGPAGRVRPPPELTEGERAAVLGTAATKLIDAEGCRHPRGMLEDAVRDLKLRHNPRTHMARKGSKPSVRYAASNTGRVPVARDAAPRRSSPATTWRRTAPPGHPGSGSHSLATPAAGHRGGPPAAVSGSGSLQSRPYITGRSARAGEPVGRPVRSSSGCWPLPGALTATSQRPNLSSPKTAGQVGRRAS
jgi:hypothetical protein